MENSRPKMELNTDLPTTPPSSLSSTASPARGAPMAQTLRRVLRAPPLVHTWEFWHDRQDRQDSTPKEEYSSRLVKLHTVSDVRAFWELFNNFPISTLPLRDSIHLFHLGVKPVWEDPRNVRGGAWTFRIKKDVDLGQEFWKSVAMLAVGETLQGAVESDRVGKFWCLCGDELMVSSV
jgi:hypothetical protein